MKTKLFSNLLATATAIATAVCVTAPASAGGFSDIPANYLDDMKVIFENEGVQFDTTTSSFGEGKLVDLSQLTLKNDSEVNIFLLGEGAGKRNSLFYSANGAEKETIWNDVSISVGKDGNYLNNGYDKQEGPLNQGDSENLGFFTKGTQMNFLLSSFNTTKREREYYSSAGSEGTNGDGLQHAVGYAFGERYLMLGFEDLYGDLKAGSTNGNENSDRDFNDVVFVIDMGKGNLATTPEPTVLLGLGVAVGGMFLTRRNKGKAS
jgi:hypothetical protein